MFDVQGDESGGPQTQHAEHEDHDQISEAGEGIGVLAEVLDDPVVLLGGEKERNGFLHLGIRQADGDVFPDHPGGGEKVEELVQAPDPGFLLMHGRSPKVGDKVGKQAVGDILRRVDRLSVDKGVELPETGRQGIA